MGAIAQGQLAYVLVLALGAQVQLALQVRLLCRSAANMYTYTDANGVEWTRVQHRTNTQPDQLDPQPIYTPNGTAFSAAVRGAPHPSVPPPPPVAARGFSPI